MVIVDSGGDEDTIGNNEQTLGQAWCEFLYDSYNAAVEVSMRLIRAPNASTHHSL